MPDSGPGLNDTSAQVRARTVYARQEGRTKGAVDLAMAWVRQQLEEKGEISTLELNKLAKEAGYVISTIKEAYKRLGCKPVNRKAVWYISLPDPNAPPPAKVERETFNDLDRNGEACEDQFNVSTEERKAYGIPDNYVVCWERYPEAWKIPGAGNLNAWKQRNPGSIVVQNHGQFVFNGDDLVLCAVPRKLVEERKAAQQSIANRLEREYKANEAGQHFDDEDEFDISNVDKVEARKRANHQVLSMRNSPSSSYSIEEYVRNNNLSEMDILRHETSMAMTGTPHGLNDMSDKEISALFEPVSDRGGRGQAQRDQGGKFVSLAPTVRPRNLMSDADRARLAVR